MTTLDLDLEGKPSRRLWLLSAAGAVAIHLACVALAVAHFQSEEDDDSLGAPTIEIGLEMSSPRTDPNDLPPGPDAEASVASPEVAEQKTEVKETDLPKDTPTETENPDQVVTQNDVKKPDEETPEKQTVQTQASTASIASEATATPSTESAPEAPRAVAPAQGMGAAAKRMKVTWQKELMAHLDRHKRYPAERQQKAAEIFVNFQLDRLGHVLSVNVAKSSGDAAFDEAAVAMVKRSDPLPQPPPIVADEGLSFTLPVLFRVKGKG